MKRTMARRLTVLGLSLALLGGTASEMASATPFVPSPVGSQEFLGGQPYAGDFPDPSMLRLGSTYVAYSTTISNKNLPVITSPNLAAWTARPSFSADAYDNDALPNSPVWSNYQIIKGRRVAPTWAPSVARVKRTFVDAYATQVAGGSRFCVSLARSSSPYGPFVDNSTKPLVCPANQGAIDPQIWVAPSGKRFLFWKTEGIRGKVPSRLWSRQLNKYATGFFKKPKHNKFKHLSKKQKKKYVPSLLLQPQQAWEGGLVENPSMIAYAGKLYLFYSGNDWASSRYAVGYAFCKSPQGPCRRPVGAPLVASNDLVVGPGGGSPFVDTAGALRLGYHAWTPGQGTSYPSSAASCKATVARANTCPQRKLHVAYLNVNPANRLLSVAQYDAQ
jgi:beta-xylosidase